MPDRTLSRRAFLRLALLPLAASAAASLAACRIAAAEDDAGKDGEPGPPPAAEDATGFVYDNHQHSAVLPASAFEAGLAAALHIQGRSPHDHLVELSAEQVAAVRAGREVIVRSTNDWGHAHEVAFNRRESA